MKAAVTFRHMEPSEALKTYALERHDRLLKYVDQPMDSQVTLKVEKFRQIADVVINTNGIRIAGEESHEDMYAAISREKQIKAGSRQKKIDLINSMNSEWLDLYETL